jgi:hypothetical protein
MKAIVRALAISSLLFAPAAFAQITEFHAIYMPNHQVEIVNTVPTVIPTGEVMLNNGAVITGGAKLSLPGGATITLPGQLHEGMFINIK